MKKTKTVMAKIDSCNGCRQSPEKIRFLVSLRDTSMTWSNTSRVVSLACRRLNVQNTSCRSSELWILHVVVSRRFTSTMPSLVPSIGGSAVEELGEGGWQGNRRHPPAAAFASLRFHIASSLTLCNPPGSGHCVAEDRPALLAT